VKITILLVVVLTVRCVAEGPSAQLAREDISNADRDALVDLLAIWRTVPTLARKMMILRVPNFALPIRDDRPSSLQKGCRTDVLKFSTTKLKPTSS
jgi:hypothetical protein